VSTSDQFGELLEAYALGALDAPERSALEAHLATKCPECTTALAEARWLVSQLAYSAPEAAPSALLRGRLMKIVGEEAASKEATQKYSIRSTQTPLRTFKPTVPYWMWAAVAALLVVALYSTWDARRLSDEMRDINARAMAELNSREKIEEELGAVRREAVILADPASVKIALATGEANARPLQAAWHAQLGIVVSGQKIPPPPGQRVLQLWLIPKAAGAKPVPSQVVRPDENGNFVLLVSNPPELMADTKALAVTEEPAGGSPQPTTTPKWVGGVVLSDTKD
jgi:anti-sigma-K factor RskA